MKLKSKKFVKSTFVLLASFLLSNCAGKQVIPNVEICAEIPFEDGREGACGTTLTKKQRIVPTEVWEAQRSHMLMIHANQWSEIRKAWKYACRVAGPDCNAQLESVDSVVRGLDNLVEKIGKMK